MARHMWGPISNYDSVHSDEKTTSTKLVMVTEGLRI